MSRSRKPIARLAAAAFLVAAVSAQAQQQGHQMPGMGNDTAPRPSGPPSAPPAPAPRPSPQGTPRPQENTSGPMSMPVSDQMVFHQVLVDELEYVRGKDARGLAWDAQGWIGRDDNRLWVKTEGERTGGRTRDASVQALWSRPVAAFWDFQAGVRHDFGEGARRNWLAVGVQGIAPYWFDVQATAFVAPSGRTAARLKAEYQFVLTQRTFLTPEVEANLYGRSDPKQRVGAGLSDMSVGLRLRHELRREISPYIGVTFNRRFGGTADYARQANERVSERQLVAGVRVWF